MGWGELRPWVAWLSWTVVAGCYAHHERPGSSGADSAVVIDAGTDAAPVIEAGVDSAFLIDSAVADARPDSAIVDAAQDAPVDAFVPDGCRAPGDDTLRVESGSASFSGDLALEQLRGYRRIRGELWIDTVTSLEPLSCLEWVDRLHITSAGNLRSLDGLERLRRADSFELASTSVQSLSALRQLTATEVMIQSNWQLTTLDGFTMTELNSLSLIRLDQLVDVSALAGLTTVAYLDLSWLPALTDVSSLASLRSVGANLWVYDTGVTTLRLPGLTSVEQFVGISDNRSLRSIEMPSLTRVSERPLPPLSYGFGIHRNPLLPQCVIDRLLQQVGHAECDCEGNNGVGMCP